MTAVAAKTTVAPGLHPTVYARILEESYGPGAWHGPDLKAAVADVTPEAAFKRPAPGRHSIAEIVLHHAWFVRSVVGQLTGRTPEPFLMKGEDWFELENGKRPTWPEIRATLQSYQDQLAKAVVSPLPEAERLDLILGIAFHAVYHAGQVQLVKRLLGD
jgi:hypothetical protein